MTSSEKALTTLTRRLWDFVGVRECGQFHSVRNLILPLIGERAVETRWIDGDKSDNALTKVEHYEKRYVIEKSKSSPAKCITYD